MQKSFGLTKISIHASAKEATHHSDGAWFHRDFNPRLREGGDEKNWDALRTILDFNPRLREGGDSVLPPFRASQVHFNPRLREGGDLFLHCLES